MPHLVDPTTAREAGFRVPVVLTAAAWSSAVEWTDADSAETGAHQDESGRLWDVLTMASLVVRRAGADVVPLIAEFDVMRVPRHLPYLGDDENPFYEVAMVERLAIVVGGTPTTATISLDEE